MTTIRGWLTDRLEHILEMPLMFGSLEAVEMQCLLLMEAIQFIDCPDAGMRDLFERYGEFVALKFIKIMPPKRQFIIEKKPLYVCAGNDVELFVKTMRDFWKVQQAYTLEWRIGDGTVETD